MNQKFYEYMQNFLEKKEAQNVVEIGSDVQLKLALKLAPYCEKFYAS